MFVDDEANRRFHIGKVVFVQSNARIAVEIVETGEFKEPVGIVAIEQKKNLR